MAEWATDERGPRVTRVPNTTWASQREEENRKRSFLTAAVKAKVHIVQNLAQELGNSANCSLTDLRMVDAARYEATKEWA